MKYISLLMAAALILSMAGCNGNTTQTQVSDVSTMESSIVESSAPESSAIRQESASSGSEASEEPDAFLEDPEFLEKAYAMGYTDDTLEGFSQHTAWTWTKEELLYPPIEQLKVAATSPNGQLVIYMTDTNMVTATYLYDTGADTFRSLGLTSVFMAYYYFPDDTSYIYENTQFDLSGNVIRTFNLNSEELVYNIIYPRYIPDLNIIAGPVDASGKGLTGYNYDENDFWHYYIINADTYEVLFDCSLETNITARGHMRSEPSYIIENDYVEVTTKLNGNYHKTFRIQLTEPYSCEEIIGN